MKTLALLLLLPILTLGLRAEEPVATEADGLIRIEAEAFTKQTEDSTRSWIVIKADTEDTPKPDADPNHAEGASGGAYIEALPDTRATHDDKLIKGENFSPNPGEMAILHYPIRVETPGRYYVWARIFSTGTEDNGMHFGLNGEWPESGQRWQTVKKKAWQWDCKQRTQEVHVGVPMQLWLDIEEAGNHVLMLSMREDGAEVDAIILASDKEYRPE